MYRVLAKNKLFDNVAIREEGAEFEVDPANFNPDSMTRLDLDDDEPAAKPKRGKARAESDDIL